MKKVLSLILLVSIFNAHAMEEKSLVSKKQQKKDTIEGMIQTLYELAAMQKKDAQSNQELTEKNQQLQELLAKEEQRRLRAEERLIQVEVQYELEKKLAGEKEQEQDELGMAFNRLVKIVEQKGLASLSNLQKMIEEKTAKTTDANNEPCIIDDGLKMLTNRIQRAFKEVNTWAQAKMASNEAENDYVKFYNEILGGCSNDEDRNAMRTLLKETQDNKS